MPKADQPDGQVALQRVLAGLTPTTLLETVSRLAALEPGDEIGLRLDAVMASLLGDVSLGGGAEGWRNMIRLKRAVAAVIAEIPGLRYVEGDA